LRILLTVHQFLPKYSGGTERVTFDMAQELRARGHKVHVMTTDAASPSLRHNEAWDYEYEGLSIRVVGLDRRQLPDQLRYEFDNPDMAEHMRAYMRDVRPDLVHVVHAGRLSGSVIPAAKEFDVPVVFTATDFWSICRVIHLRRRDNGQLCLGPDKLGTNCLRCFVAQSNEPKETKDAYLKKSDAEFGARAAASRTSLMRRTKYLHRTRMVLDRIDFLKDAVNMTDRVLAPTRLTRDLLIRNGITPRLIKLLPYGMDTSHIVAAPRSPVRPSVLKIGYIGSIAQHKGPDVLISAFRHIPRTMKAELKVYGDPRRDPSYFDKLEKLAKGDDRRISFLGTFETERIGWILSDIDVLVVPSRWYENTPLVVYSAFASGTPVVATDVGGLSEVVEHERNGLLFKMNDSVDLNRKLLRFFSEPDLLKSLREGIEPVKTAEESADELEDLYRELLGSTKPIVRAAEQGSRSRSIRRPGFSALRRLAR
jgi:glycosyltransferase involved in cell wall biosynthesis